MRARLLPLLSRILKGEAAITQADTLDFPVQWDNDNDRTITWSFDPSHTPDPATPLGFDLYYGPFIEGFGWARARLENFYVFIAEPAGQGDPQDVDLKRLARGIRRWHQEIIPELVSTANYYLHTDFETMSNVELTEEIERLPAVRKRLGQLHTLSLFPFGLGMRLLIDTYRELVSDDELAAVRLVQGYGNKSVEAGHALWRVSKTVTAIPTVRERILRHGSAQNCLEALESQPAARPFLDEFAAFLDEFGWRADLFELAHPTWAEDATIPLGQLRSYLELLTYDPIAELERQAAVREQAIAETMARLAPDEQQRLRGILEVVKDAACLQEDHNYYIDQRCAYAPRRLILAAGRRLLDDPADVFYLSSAQLVAALQGEVIDVGALAHEGKQEMARWAQVRPPSWIGAPPQKDGRDRASPLGTSEAPPGELRGTGSSAGIARGPARVLLSLTEAERLQPGDVLVARTTMPAWTPLFAVASALVTEVGGVLSHAAVTAREYGLPAVLNVTNATKRIRDGQLVEVDGANGLVRIIS